MNSFEQKRQERIERLKDRAAAAQAESDRLQTQASARASVIPLGQPILVGHHSERRDRNYRNKIHRQFEKSIEAADKAKYYADKAKAAERNTAIFSDDPNAAEKLEKKIARLEERQELMKAANKAIRKGDDEALRLLGFSDERIAALKKPDFLGRIGFPNYAITNNGANIRRLKERLGHIQEKASDQTTEKVINGVSIVDNVEANRLQLFFPGKPNDEIRSELKSCGFRWSPNEGAWQRHRSSSASYYAEKIVQKLAPPTPPSETPAETV